MESEAEPNPPGGPVVTEPDHDGAASGSMPQAAAPPAPPAGEAPTTTLLSAPDAPDAPLPAPDAPPPVQKKPSILFLVTVTVISLAADLVTKGWAKAHLAGYDNKLRAAKKFTVIKDHFDFIFAQNPGGAWSFLRSLPDTLRRPFFLVVSAGAIVFIISIYRRIHPDQRAMKWGLPLALGGAMGNLADRIRYGWVVDFMDAYLVRGGVPHHWPTFNVADIAIVVGVGLMAIDMISSRGQKQHPDIKPAPAAAAPPAA